MASNYGDGCSIGMLISLNVYKKEDILDDYQPEYKASLTKLKLLPLMMIYEPNDILFFVSNYKEPTNSFNIMDFVGFNNSHTRSGFCKLTHSQSSNNQNRHFYFNRLIRLWNSLSVLNVFLSKDTLMSQLKNFLWLVFISKFTTSIPCTYHFVYPCNRCLSIPRQTNSSLLPSMIY